MPHAYDGFHSLKEAKKHYKRCRKNQHFILDKSSLSKMKLICPVCKEPLKDGDTNRCVYFPKGDEFLTMHYSCIVTTVSLSNM